jgi:HK97 family phage major capsid protein
MAETADSMRRAGEVQKDPALAVLADIKDNVATQFEVAAAERKRDREEAQGLVKAVNDKLEATRTEMVAGFRTTADQIHTLERRSIAISGGGRDLEGSCLAALSDEQRRDISVMDWMLPAGKRNAASRPILSNPVGATLVAHWLYASFMIQKRRFGSQQQQADLYTFLEKAEKALLDAVGVQKAAALTTGTDTLGGHWIPDPVAAELYRLILDHSVFGSLATHVPMTTKTLDLPVEGSSALSVSWGSENTAITDSVPASNATNKVTLTAARLNGRAQSSIEEIMDSPISILNWVQTKLTELAGREIDNQCLEGTQFSGQSFLGNSSVNEFTTGANGDAITYALLADIVFKARERASRSGARWFVAPETMGKIVGLVDTSGQPVVHFGAAAVQGPVATTILGYPVEVHSVISASRTYGTGTTLSHIYFGPPSAMVLGDRMGMSWDVTDQPNFTAATVDMRLITRLAVGCAVPKALTRKLYVDV